MRNGLYDGAPGAAATSALPRRSPRAVDASRDAPDASVSVIIPTLNEAKNLPWVLERIPHWVDEVVLVDGLSTDGTIDVGLAHYPALKVVHETERGKGAALRAGFAAATSDVVVIIDADGSMDPAEICRLAAPICGDVDLVKGSRFLAGGGSDDITIIRRAGNRALLALVNGLYRTSYTDLCYGFIALRRSALEQLDLGADGFEIETEIVVRAAKTGLRVREVPSLEHRRRYGTSNLRSIRDGFRVLRTLLARRFSGPTPRPGEPDADVVIDLRDDAAWLQTESA